MKRCLLKECHSHDIRVGKLKRGHLILCITLFLQFLLHPLLILKILCPQFEISFVVLTSVNSRIGALFIKISCVVSPSRNIFMPIPRGPGTVSGSILNGSFAQRMMTLYFFLG